MMDEPRYIYDELSDTLNLCFRPGKGTSNFKLHDYILVKWDRDRGEIMGLFIEDYSILSRQTDSGAQSIPLSGLIRLSPELREAVLAELRQPAIERVLTLSSFH